MLDDDVFLGNFDDLRPGNEIAGSENLSVDFGGRSRKIVENAGNVDLWKEAYWSCGARVIAPNVILAIRSNLFCFCFMAWLNGAFRLLRGTYSKMPLQRVFPLDS